MHRDLLCAPFFPFLTCPSTYIFPKPLADLSQQCHSCQQHGLHGTWCHWPQWEEFTAAESEIFSKPKTEMNHSRGRLQCKRADFSVCLLPGCGSLETKSQGYLYAMLFFYIKILSLVTKRCGSWFLDWSNFKQARSCTKAVFHSELSGVREMEEFKQCQGIRGSSKQTSFEKEGSRGYIGGMQAAVEKEKWWYSGVGYSSSLLQQLVSAGLAAISMSASRDPQSAL